MIRQLFLLSSIASTFDAFITPPSLHANSPVVASTTSSWQKSQPLISPLHSDATSEDDGAETTANEEPGSLPSEEESDILNSPAFLTRKVEVLQSDIAAMEKEIEEANTVYLAAKEEWGAKFDRLNSDSQSMQERLSKQGKLGTEMATVDVAGKMLNVLDNYDRAFQSIEATTNEEVDIVNDYKNTYDMILNAFQELNVTKVETVGTEFNFTEHQAMMTMASDEYEEGIVCQEFAMGWKCGTEDGEWKLIRPAMVAVAD